MHAQYWESLTANLLVFEGRKEVSKASLVAAIAGHGSHCPKCASTDIRTHGPAVTVLWVGISLRFELAVPRRKCCVCQHEFSLKPLQLGCLPATAVQGWDLTKVVFGGRPMWFELQLLQVRGSNEVPSIDCHVVHCMGRLSCGMRAHAHVS